jgi:hypothetical protein
VRRAAITTAADVPHHKNDGRGPFGIVAGRVVRTVPDPLGALGHAIGVVGIVIDFQPRTKAKRLRQLQKNIN